ncbi:ribosome-recycling factor, mitochondrial-like [Styela clava]
MSANAVIPCCRRLIGPKSLGYLPNKSFRPALHIVRAKNTLSNDVILCTRMWQPYTAVNFHTSVIFNKDKGKPKKTKKQEVLIRAEDAEEFIDLNLVHDEMLEVIEKLKHDFVHQFRIGANMKILDNIKVLLQGDEFQLREVATITKKSPKLLEVDFVNFPEALASAQSAIECSGMNLNPKVKGTKLEVLIPVVTAEHRKALVKAAKFRMNESKDETRKIQKFHEKKLSKVEHLPETIGIVIKKQIHIYVDANLKEAETIFKAKEKDLLIQQ